MKRNLTSGLIATAATLLSPVAAFAAEGGASSDVGLIAIGSGIAIGAAAVGGALGQGKAVSAGLDAIGRNPSAQNKLFVPMLLGLAFVESLVILAFVIAIQLAGKVG